MSIKITIPKIEVYDEVKNEFIEFKEQTISFEHSLVSLSKWEAKWHKPFLENSKKITKEELDDYIRCMTLTQNVDDRIYSFLPESVIRKLLAYIEDPMTATWFSKTSRKPNRQIITAEIIYYWMIQLNIPFECRKWHLNSLLTLIRVCNEKNQPPKKMSRNDQIKQQKSLNAARRAALHSRG